jgi:glycosyltransferase involved in cell wall biosynthesis
MKIAYFTGSFAKGDGVVRVLMALGREACKKNIPVVIVTSRTKNKSISPVPLIEVPSVALPLYREYRLALPGMRGFEKELDAFEPDIIHIHSPDAIAWAAVKYAKKHKIPIVATYHTNFALYASYFHLSFLKPFVWSMLRRVYRKMLLVTTPSDAITEELKNRKISNPCTVPWGVASLV